MENKWIKYGDKWHIYAGDTFFEINSKPRRPAVFSKCGKKTNSGQFNSPIDECPTCTECIELNS